MKNIQFGDLVFLIALTLLLLFHCTDTQAQSVDSLWGFKQAREFTDANRTTLLIPLAAANVAAAGIVHGAFYATYGGNDYPLDIHGAAEILGAVHYATAYTAGLDPIQAMGATMVGNFVWQCAINTGSGLPCVNPNEAYRYEAFGMDVSWKRGFLGRGRWISLGIGVGLIAYKPIYRFVRRELF